MSGFMYCRGQGCGGGAGPVLLWVPAGRQPLCPACQALADQAAQPEEEGADHAR